MTNINFDDMDDEAFLNIQGPGELTPADEQPVVQEEEQQEEPPVTDPVEDESQTEEPEGEADEGDAEGGDEEGEKPKGDEELSDTELDNKATPTITPEKPVVEDTKSIVKKEKEPVTPKETPTEQTVDYKSEFEKLIGKPIKANGKEITLKNADEALRLIQQGAGYAQKMEQLKPARKSAAMLENAGLLGNEVALAQMIDAWNGSPEAIAKLIKDLKIDIFALDLDAGDKYSPVSHLQTDEAVNFQDTLKEVRTLEGGKEAMALIDAMDQKSKDMIWGNAQAIRQIYDYKQNGVYDTVATEVERRRTLGEIPADVPFIVAFGQVGEEMAKAAAAAAPDTAPVQPNTPTPPVPAKPVARTPVASGPAPRKQEALDPRASAAASPRSGTGGQAKQPIDIYQYSDDDIEKMSAPPV